MNKIGKIKSWYIDPDDNRPQIVATSAGELDYSKRGSVYYAYIKQS